MKERKNIIAIVLVVLILLIFALVVAFPTDFWVNLSLNLFK